jgi:hypothetical protein
VALFCVQSLDHLGEHVAERIHRQFAFVEMQDFDETGHVRAFEVVRQVHVHVEVRHRVLVATRAIFHPNRVINVFDADLVDRDAAIVRSALDVFNGRRRGRGGNGGVHDGILEAVGRHTPSMSRVRRWER